MFKPRSQSPGPKNSLSRRPCVCEQGQPYSNPGPGCLKLTTSLVNVSLKFQAFRFYICQYFLLKKYFFQQKNFSEFGYKVVKHLTI